MSQRLKNLFIAAFVAAALCSCGTLSTSSSPLYYWGGYSSGASEYESYTYRDYKKQSPEAICQLVCVYEKMITNPGGLRQMPPPGVCAEYGYLLLLPETATAFTEKATQAQRKMFEGSDYFSLFNERAKEVLQKELELYPESRIFLEPLIKKWTAK